MTVQADLHMHSTASDGQYSPAEVVALAQKAGVRLMALTDHDTLDGLPEAQEAGKALGIQVLRGIELGAREYRSLHILGYHFSQEAPALRALCQKLVNSRNQRKYRLVEYLKERGVEIDLREVEEVAGGSVIARPHFARVMVAHGYVKTTEEAFDRYLDTSAFQKIERFKADARTCIETIHADGGKVSLAHPYQLNMENEELEQLVAQLKEYGLDALECWYPRHTPEQRAFYLSLARKYRLHVSGGNDFHGEQVKPDIAIHPLTLDLDWLLT